MAYIKVYEQQEWAIKFCGYSKIHKKDNNLRPIVSSREAVTYGVGKEIASILRPLVGQSPQNIKNTQDFVEQVKNMRLEEGHCIKLYAAKVLFTFMPVDPNHHHHQKQI